MIIDICVLVFILMSAGMFLAIVGGCIYDYIFNYDLRDEDHNND